MSARDARTKGASKEGLDLDRIGLLPTGGRCEIRHDFAADPGGPPTSLPGSVRPGRRGPYSWIGRSDVIQSDRLARLKSTAFFASWIPGWASGLRRSGHPGRWIVVRSADRPGYR